MPSEEKTRDRDQDQDKVTDENTRKEEESFDLDEPDIEDIIEEARQHAKRRRKGGQ